MPGPGAASPCSAWPWPTCSLCSRCRYGLPTTWVRTTGPSRRPPATQLPATSSRTRRWPLLRPSPRAFVAPCACPNTGRPPNMCCPAAPRLCHHLAPRWAVPLAASSTPHIAEPRFSCGALPGLAYATVVFFVAAFLLVLVAFVNLALALTVPSGPGLSGLHRRLARTIDCSGAPAPLLSLSGALPPAAGTPSWPGRRAPPAATRLVPGRLLHAQHPAYTQPGAVESKQLLGRPVLLLLLRALHPLGPLGAELWPRGGGPGRMGPPLPLSRKILASTPSLPLPISQWHPRWTKLFGRT